MSAWILLFFAGLLGTGWRIVFLALLLVAIAGLRLTATAPGTEA